MEEAPTCLVTYPVEYFFFFPLCPELLQDNGATCCPLVHTSTATCPAPTRCHHCIPIHALQLVKYFFFSFTSHRTVAGLAQHCRAHKPTITAPTTPACRAQALP